ncbi:response regulator [Chondrinema litorale]|uniref:response regulator n=1 Tax=Chondrinema litorale TaxID=2994555 RepID=UPI002542F58F|nr:response regulator [Chondrinema litorale]UZR94402.1 response regulator [Chondrinema litorale]
MTQFNTVLIIDDDEISNFVSHKLIEQSSFAKNIISYDCAQNALSYINEMVNNNIDDLPDMILLDINMPVMDGWKFLEEYSGLMEGVNKKIALYMLSSSVYSKDFEVASKNKYVTGYIVKPLSREKLDEICKVKESV